MKSKEYPKLKPGDRIRVKNEREAAALGTNLACEGFQYINHGSYITIVEEKELNGRFKSYRLESKEGRRRS